MIAAAANAVLDVVDDAQLCVEVTDKGETLAEGLRDIGLEGVRGRGLMLAFEIADAPDVARKSAARAAPGRERDRPDDDPPAAPAHGVAGRDLGGARSPQLRAMSFA